MQLITLKQQMVSNFLQGNGVRPFNVEIAVTFAKVVETDEAEKLLTWFHPKLERLTDCNLFANNKNVSLSYIREQNLHSPVMTMSENADLSGLTQLISGFVTRGLGTMSAFRVVKVEVMDLATGTTITEINE